jgi:hypothetical protein
MVEGGRVATVLRQSLKAHYGVRSEKLAEFGVKPFRGRTRKAKPPQIEIKPAVHIPDTPG